ncbi:MAG: hypothetical protein HZB55_22930 [Deltaproteobacteria bacterium]|nr:hypothetical protein [Deltaproteobacteria bacterium]
MLLTNDRRRLVTMLRRLLDDLERHESDYHHITPRTLVQEARALLQEFDPKAKEKQGSP